MLTGACSIAVGSRYLDAARAAGLAGPYRRTVSQASRLVVRSLFPPTQRVQDPLSGFFSLGQGVITDTALAPEGFKILLEVLIRGHWDEVRKIAYEFAARRNGGSKAGWHEGAQFLRQVWRLRLPDGTPERYPRLVAAYGQTVSVPTGHPKGSKITGGAAAKAKGSHPPV